jgi:hypothetical protein
MYIYGTPCSNSWLLQIHSAQKAYRIKFRLGKDSVITYDKFPMNDKAYKEFLSSGIMRRVLQREPTDVSKEHVSSIIKATE